MKVVLVRIASALASMALIATATIGTSLAQTHNQAAARDGSRDFDFNLATWTTHIRLRPPLSSEDRWSEMTGRVVVHPIFGGRGQYEEIEATGPHGSWQDFTLFLYDPAAHQWTMSFANSAGGVLSVPMAGAFENGRGEFYDQEPLQGRMVLARQVWSDITPTSHHLEQSFSDDGGKTWIVNFVADLTKQH